MIVDGMKYVDLQKVNSFFYFTQLILKMDDILFNNNFYFKVELPLKGNNL